MSDEIKMLVREEPLHAHDKKELTYYLRDLMIRPKCGQVVLHYNNFDITNVEQVLKVKN